MHYNGSVDSQLTVRLPKDLDKRLRSAARRMQRRPSDVVRLAIQQFLGADEAAPLRHADRVRELLGAVESGVPDLAVRHRHYVLETLKRGR
jgi:predicted transcriptional regulator